VQEASTWAAFLRVIIGDFRRTHSVDTLQWSKMSFPYVICSNTEIDSWQSRNNKFDVYNYPIKHILYKLMHCVHNRLTKDSNVVYAGCCQRIWTTASSPRDDGFGLVPCCQRKLYFHSSVLTTLSVNANACRCIRSASS
jgi:hypothetical protein